MSDIFRWNAPIHGVPPLLRASHGHLRDWNFAWPRPWPSGSHVMDWNGVEWCFFLRIQWDFLGFEGYQHLEKPWKMVWFKGQSMENSHLFHGNHQLRWIPGSTQRNTPGKGFQHFHPMPIFRMSPKVWHKKWQHTTLHWALNLNP